MSNNRNNNNKGNNDDRDRDKFNMSEVEKEIERLRNSEGFLEFDGRESLPKREKSIVRVESISRLHRDALEGSHLVVTGENVIEFMNDYLAMIGRKRMLGMVEGLRMFKGVGVGYYQGGLYVENEKSFVDMLEEIGKRKFIRTLLLVDVINELDLEVLDILDGMMADGVQIIAVMSDNVEIDEDKRLMGTELVDLLKYRMRENYRWGREMLSDK